jgi:outer membrane protein assembly factor BamA
MGTGTRRLRAALIALVLALAGPEAGEAKWSFVPIPEIVTDPNEGNTFGLLGVFLITDDNDEVRYMIAPDATYNETKGFYPVFRLFGYPHPDRRYSVTLGKSTTKDENYELEFSDRGLSVFDLRTFIATSFIYERDSTERFFGIGNESDEDHESNYTGNLTRALGSAGVWLLPRVNAAYEMRIERYSIGRGQVDSIPFVQTEFPGMTSQDLFDATLYWTHRVAVAYDSRDSFDIPSHGMYSELYLEGASQSLGSSTWFIKFGLNWRQFIPLRESGNPILALRAVADYMTADDATPFWELNSVGGRRSLRAYGGDRFIDLNRTLAGGELRTRVWQRRMFGVNAEIEVAPFVETGKVFPHVGDNPVNHLHWASGVGFRGIARPQIVGFVDVGAGSEGVAVFTGVNYPF